MANRKDFFANYKKINQNKKEVALTVDSLENRKLFFLLTSLISSLATAQTLEDALESFYNLGGNSTLVKRLFIYLKLPRSMMKNLVSSNVSIAGEELVLLKNYIFQMMGDGTIYNFVNHAIENQPKPDVLRVYDLDDTDSDTPSYDEYDMDWSFYTEKSNCTDQKDKKIGSFKKVCHEGTRGGKKVFWLYPTDFEGAKGGMSGKNHKSKRSYSTKPFSKNSKTAEKDAKKEVADKKKAENNKDKEPNKKPNKKSTKKGNLHVTKSLFEKIGV